MQIIAYISLLILFYFLYKAIIGGEKTKLKVETMSLDRLERYLAKLVNEDESGSYKFFEYKKIPFRKTVWHLKDIEEIKESIKTNCTKIGAQGVGHYAKAQYSIYRDTTKNYVYFYIGNDNYKFKDIKKRS